MKALYLSVGLIILSVVVYYSYLDSAYEKVKIQRENLEITNLVINQAIELQSLRDSLVEKLNSISPEDRDNISNSVKIFDTNEVIGTIQAFKDLAISSNVDLEDFSSSVNPDSEDILTTLEVEFSITTNVSTMGQFLDNFERWIKGALIDEVSFSVVEDGGVKTDIKSTVYFIQPDVLIEEEIEEI